MYISRLVSLALFTFSIAYASPAPEPIDSGTAAVVSNNDNLGCSGKDCRKDLAYNNAALQSRHFSAPAAAIALGVLVNLV